MERSSSVFNNQFSISQFGEYYLPSVNRNTFEKVDSTTAFKQKFKQDIFAKDTLHIVLGLDSGLLVNYILEAPKTDGSKYIFVELPEVMNMLNIEIPTEQQDYLKVISFDELTHHIESAEDDLYFIKDQIAVTLSLAASSGVIEEYSTLYSQAYRTINQHSISHKTNFNQKSFFEQQMFNVVENQLPASLLKNKFLGKTAIVIGGGPSLDLHLEWIKENYQQLFIFTVSRFAAKLSQAGIPAHIIVSVDPQDTSFEVNRDMMKLAGESLFINSHHVNHRILAQWQGKSLFLGDQLPWIETDNILTIGPTVTNSAIRIAIEMGFEQVLLTGVDFCHSPTGVTHAKGSLEASAGSKNSKIHEWVETYSGQIAETPIQLLYAAQGLEEEASQFPNVKIINLSEHAAKIKGVAYKNFNDINIVSAQCSPAQLLAMIPSSTDNESSFLSTLETEVIDAKNAFVSIKKLSQKALNLTNSARKLKPESIEYQGKVKEIDSIETKINKKFNRYNMSIKVFGYFEFSQFLTTKKKQDWSEQHMLKMIKLYYSAYEVITQKLQNLTETSIETIRIRREETKVQPNIELLTIGWNKYNQPGRVWLLEQKLNATSLDTLSAKESEQLAESKKQYQEQLTSFSHPYFAMKKTNQNLDNTLAKILDLKKHNNIKGLTLLINSIRPLIEKDAFAARLLLLAEHYIYFIEKDFESSLQSLLQIEKADRTELELKQLLLVALKLHQLDLAEQTIKSLSLYSDEYFPQLAHIFSLQGNNQQALDTYLDYLDKYPTDEGTLLKLGIFLAKIGQLGGAKSAFEQVLSINPDSISAKNYLEQVLQQA